MSDPSSDFAIAAWFQLATSNQFNFPNALKQDVVIRTTDDSQRILIGPTAEDENGIPQPSLLTLTGDDMTLNGDVIFAKGALKTQSPDQQALAINDVTFSNASLHAQNIVVDDVASFRNVLKASQIKMAGETVFNEQGKLTPFGIATHSITDEKIARKTLTNEALQEETIQTNALASQIVTREKIAHEAVGEEELGPQSVTTEKYAPYSINNKALDDHIISTRNYKASSINTAALSNNAVKSEKLAPDLTFIGDTRITGTLGINTRAPFLDQGSLPENIPPPDSNTSLDVYEKISIIGRNKERAYLFSRDQNIGINRENPSFTIDVAGQINCTDGLFQNGNRLLFTQWSSTPNPFPNCNLVYNEGFVGINETTPSAYLHVKGDIKLTSNLIFKNSDLDEASFLHNESSNIGIHTLNPQATLDIGGNLAINNTPVMDGDRHMFNINTLNVKDRIFVNGTEGEESEENDKAEENNIQLKVKGNVQYDAQTFLVNPFHMFISSKGEFQRNGPLYFKLARIYAPNDSRNLGPFVIQGSMGDTFLSRNAYVHIVLSSRNFPSDANLERINVTHVYGGIPFEISRFTDLELYEDTSSNRELYVYLKTTFSSSFHLELQSANGVVELDPVWYEKGISTLPNVQRSELKKVKSLVHDDHAIVSSYGGELTVGQNLTVKNGIHSHATFSNVGDIVTEGAVIRGQSGNKSRSLFDIYRYPDQSSVALSTNTYRLNDNSWYVYDGEHGALQMIMTNSGDASEGHESGAFTFKGRNTQMGDDHVAIALHPWVTFRDGKVGINSITHPDAPLHVSGDALFENGQIRIKSGPGALSETAQDFLHFSDKDGMVDGHSRTLKWGRNYADDRGLAALSYTYKDEKDERSVSFGFSDKAHLTLKGNDFTGLHTESPQAPLHVVGNSLLQDGYMAYSGEQSKVAKLEGISRTFTHFSSLDNTWEKLAYLKPSADGDTKNKGSISFEGHACHADKDVVFKAIMFYDALSADNCYSLLDVYQTTENTFLSDLDLAAYVDDAQAVHVYIKSRASQMRIGIHGTFVQIVGDGIALYTDKRKTFNNVGFFDDFTAENIGEKDDEVSGNVQFRLNVRNDARLLTRHKDGHISLGREKNEHKLDVSGDVGADHVVIREGTVQTGSGKTFAVNGTSFVSPDGDFITANIPDGSLSPEKFAPETQDVLWQSTVAILGVSNVHIQGERFGLFTSNIAKNNICELGVRLTLSSNVDLAELGQEVGTAFGEVQLTTGLSNGLGINVPHPKFPLDVAGNINLSGDIYKNGVFWETNPFQPLANFITSPSNILIGQDLVKGARDKFDEEGFVEDIAETISIQTHMSLSNMTGKTVLTSRNGFMGVNQDQPSTTVDIAGNLGIHNMEVLDADRNMRNINTFKSPMLQVHPDFIAMGEETEENENDGDALLRVHGDINMNGTLFVDNEYYHIYRNQWVGSNAGIYYKQGAVGIGTDIPSDEALSIYERFSLSNSSSKISFVMHEESDNVFYTNTSHPLYAPGLGLSNSEGFGQIKAYGSNVGIGYSLNNNNSEAHPQFTLDVRGNMGIKGTEVFSDEYVMSNINAIYTPHLTLTESALGVNNRAPGHALSVNGAIALDNENIVLEVIDNLFNVKGEGLLASNVIIQGMPEQNGLSVFGHHGVSSNKSPISSGFSDPASIVLKGPHARLHTISEENAASAYHAFYDAQSNYAFIGLDGAGLYGDSNGENSDVNGSLTLGTKNALRVVSGMGNEERLRVTADGDTGFGTAFPMFTVDVAGSGIGMAGSAFVDIERNVSARNIRVDDALQTRNLKANAISAYDYKTLNLKLTGSVGGLRTTDKNFGDFATFSNLLNNEPRGSIIMMEGSNIYFNATNNEGGSSFLNIAYQPVQKDAILPGNSNIQVDVYNMDNQKTNTMIGNALVVGDNLDVVNPRGHTGSTHMRIRNWDPYRLESSASNTYQNFFELRMENDRETEKIVSSLHSDHQINVMIENTSMMEFRRNSETNVWVPQTRTFGLSRLSSGGVKQVYADNRGNLTSNSSDRRMKKDIQKLSMYGLETVLKMQPVTFYWTDKFTHPVTQKEINVMDERGPQREVGLIAQEAQSIYPECVGENEDQTLHIDYGKIVPLLIRSIHELYAENQNIKKILQKII